MGDIVETTSVDQLLLWSQRDRPSILTLSWGRFTRSCMIAKTAYYFPSNIGKPYNVTKSTKVNLRDVLNFFSPSVYERPLLLQSDNFVIKIHPGRGRCRNCVNNLAVFPPPPPLMVTTKWPPVLWCTKRKLVCFCLFVWLLASCHSPTTVVRVCVIWSWVSAQKFLIIRWFILPNNAKGKCEHQWFGTFSFYRYVTN